MHKLDSKQKITLQGQLESLLQMYWGYSQFRSGQLAIIKTIIDYPASLALLATGGGKSICYQIAGLYLGGTTIVISPLISLMQDQVRRLQQQGIAAVYYNSTLSIESKTQIKESLLAGAYKFLYLGPEALLQRELRQFIRLLPVGLLAIDEAHCVSIWGHDFRPAFLEIKTTIAILQVRNPQLRVAGFTATATRKVEADITEQLGLLDCKVSRTSFARTNLGIQVLPHYSDAQLLSLLQERQALSPVIIYTNSRKRAEALTMLERQSGLLATYYHGGLARMEREQVLEAFLTDKYSVINATNAFGMGVDKANIYTVIHDQLPDSIENYYQEAGRAGRDGKESLSFVNYSWKGINFRRQMLENNYLSQTLANRIYNYLRKALLDQEGYHYVVLQEVLLDVEGINLPKFKHALELFAQVKIVSLKQSYLQRDSAVDSQLIIQFRLLKPNIIFLGKLLSLGQGSRLYRDKLRKLAKTVELFSTEQCRLKNLLTYFSETSDPCGKCDNCLGTSSLPTEQVL